MVLVEKAPAVASFLPPTRLAKASWESKNEGVHERVNFDDTIWGFDLAGGAYYNTPLRVTLVKDDSRAQKAGIRPGDNLLKINDIPTETLTLQEAHDIIISSGIHIRLAVTAPEDTETTYSYWEDPLPAPKPVEKPPEEPVKKRYMVCKTNANWDLQWPWCTLPKKIYKESNCYLVHSRFEDKYGHKLLPKTETKPTSFEPINFRRRSVEQKVIEVEE